MIKTYALLSTKLANGETMAYRSCGEKGEVMILIHGNMTSSKHYDLLMERLEDTYRIYAVDMRGFGGSSYNQRFDSLKELAEDVKLFMDALHIEKAHLVGWSTGGGVALELAALYPERVDKVVLIASVGVKGYPMFKKDEKGQPIPGQFLLTKEDIEGDGVQVRPILKAYEERNKELMKGIWNALIYTHNQPEKERYDQYVEDMFTQRNLVDIYHALIHFNMSGEHNGIRQGEGTIHNVQSPVLILQGDRDYVVPMTMAESIYEGLGERGRLHILKDGGHSPLVDCLDELEKTMKDFLSHRI